MLNFIKQLFKKQESHNVPFLQEMIERSEQEQAAYQYWKSDDRKDYIMSFLASQIKATKNSDLLILNNLKSRGFILQYDVVEANMGTDEFCHLFDYFKEQILKLSYVTYMSDVKNFVRKAHVETIERHYLKPRFSYDEELLLADQQYGNLLIEHLLHDQKSIHIKFVCNIYNDRKWTKPLDFDDLMKNILF